MAVWGEEKESVEPNGYQCVIGGDKGKRCVQVGNNQCFMGRKARVSMDIWPLLGCRLHIEVEASKTPDTQETFSN